jgi:hypothetical protein
MDVCVLPETTKPFGADGASVSGAGVGLGTGVGVGTGQLAVDAMTVASAGFDALPTASTASTASPYTLPHIRPENV